ncbi:M23 family metallopeptidase [Cryobacterium tepidiphilum]|nr:M23 family metallopeptidase [Cryobacterium tepidiphilum]
MVAVGGMAVTTSIPALALTQSVGFATVAEEGGGSAPAQSLAVGADATATPVERDGFTVKEAPKVISAPSDVAGYSAAPLTAARGGEGWLLPVAGPISDPFGPRPDKPVPGVGDFHEGTDIAAACGQPVSAAAGGTVASAGWNGTYGNWILIDNGDGIQTGYAHNSSILVGEGQTVTAGDVIAEVGSTGASSGCHLHFEVRTGGTQVDPQAFMNERGVSLG